VDFTFDDEQNALREAVSGLLARAYGDSEARRRVTAADPGFDEKTWARLAEMGLLGLPFPEESGGMGAGPVEVAVVAEEIGRVIAPEPYVEAVVLAGGLIQAEGTAAQREELIGGLAGGSLVPAFAHAEPGTRWTPTASGVKATEDGGTWRLTGVKEPVLNGARADVLVVSAVAAGGTRLFVVRGDADGLTRTGYRTHDGGRAAKVEVANTPAEPLGDGGAEPSVVILAAGYDGSPDGRLGWGAGSTGRGCCGSSGRWSSGSAGGRGRSGGERAEPRDCAGDEAGPGVVFGQVQ
jgi:alkylation response protein AidB-like acyl-CoA dehydrogenase